MRAAARSFYLGKRKSAWPKFASGGSLWASARRSVARTYGGSDMNFPLGWPVVPAANVRRHRLLAGATALVGVGDQVRPDQAIAERPGSGGERVPVLAGLAGRVTQVVAGRALTIEGVATVIQG